MDSSNTPCSVSPKSEAESVRRAARSCDSLPRRYKRRCLAESRARLTHPAAPTFSHSQTQFFSISEVSSDERVTVYTPTNDSDKKKAREPSHSPAKDYTKDGSGSNGGGGTPPTFQVAVPIVNQNIVLSSKRSFLVGPGTSDVDSLPPPAKRGRAEGAAR